MTIAIAKIQLLHVFGDSDNKVIALTGLWQVEIMNSWGHPNKDRVDNWNFFFFRRQKNEVISIYSRVIG